jgi:uncharacterized heparinase superfamily protein
VFPDAERDAAACAERILAGNYNLLGYRSLDFGQPFPDWHLDPIAQRRAPSIFWADVNYLDPASGDHKVIWELNRHQHWLMLGRAYWLTGEMKYRRRIIDELASWLEANPPLAGINWSSMLELAFRSISWLWTIHLAADASPADPPWLVDLLVALDRQLTHIEHNLSYYFSPNTHLLGEALALYVCGRALPELAASARRETTGRRTLLDEIDRQIERDGGHAERSMHYHRYALDFYILALAVARLTRDPAADRFEEAVARLAAAARLCADNLGRLPHIGDDDGGSLFPIAGRPPDDARDSLAIAAALTGRDDLQIGGAPEEMLWMLSGFEPQSVRPVVPDERPWRSGALPDTGYYISRSASEHIVIDGGRHGYRNAGHAHADALSLTLSVRGLPLLIDPGTFCYTIDSDLRDRMRSTPLHNTVVLDDRSQSVPRGPFHWAQVADARVRAWRANDGFDYFDGAHNGYAPVEHRRRVFVLRGDLVVVADLLAGAGPHRAAAHWHLDPAWTVEEHGSRATFSRGTERVRLAAPAGRIECVSGDATTGLGWYSPVYGALERSTTVRIWSEASAPFWLISVFDLNPLNGELQVESVPVWAEAGSMANGAAIRIERSASVDYVLFAEAAASSDVHKANPAAASRATWRVGDIETDASMLFCRTARDRPVARLAMVDGSIVRTSGRRGFSLALPRVASDLYLDFASDPRVAGAAFGARLVVGGEELPIALDRRAEPRVAD